MVRDGCAALFVKACLASLLLLQSWTTLSGCDEEASPHGGKMRDGVDAGIRPDQGTTPDTGSGADVPAEPDTGLRLAGYREPCQDNADCASGWCVPLGSGHVCTRPCNDDCEDGWHCRGVVNEGGDAVFLCLAPGDRLCSPCLGDEDCNGGSCLALDPGDRRTYCVQPCVEGTCRAGFVCRELEQEGQTLGPSCVPATGTCTCTADKEGMDRLCTRENALGTCLGREVCHAELGWTGCSAAEPQREVCNERDDDCSGFVDDVPGLGDPCSRRYEAPDGALVCHGTLVCVAGEEELQCTAAEPRPESCNGRDEDCDGLVDEDFPELGSPCEQGQGACRRQGMTICTEDGSGTRCSIEPLPPGLEDCNYLDDDCDGETDEDFRDALTGAYAHFAHCGACGLSCEDRLPNAVARCASERPVPSCVVDTCNPGFYPVSEVSCAVLEDPGCQPCATDAGCGAAGNRCVAWGADGEPAYCARDCSSANLYGTEEGWCPAGFVCTATPDGLEPEGRVCLPASGSCSCLLPEHAGNTRACSMANDSGTCFGLETCDPLKGWSACSAAVPAGERCNGVDDDCDGRIDEGFDTLNQPCTSGAGICRREGVLRCNEAGDGVICSAEAAPQQVEACNGLDDDCDGEVDEDFRDPLTHLYVLDAHCGACDRSCVGAIPFATAAACEVRNGTALCLAVACEEDAVLSEDRRICIPLSGVTDCSPCREDAHCALLPGGACEQSDDGWYCTRECAAAAGDGCPEGFACEAGRCRPVTGACSCLALDAGEVRVCVVENEHGSCVGEQSCDPRATPGWSPCSAAVPAAEVCDGLDNDCNGLIDEGVAHPAGAVCEQANAWGTCTGTQVCAGAEGWRCSAAQPGPELCDRLDNDCDSQVDESWPELNTACSVGVGACLRRGVQLCRPDGAGTFCQAEPGTPAPEQCNGLDDDCDGLSDEDYPGLGTACSAGVGACRWQGVRVCSPDGGSVVCNAAAGQPAAEVCNGLDDDCDGTADEDFPDLFTACAVGRGVCLRQGVMVCAIDGSGTECDAVPGQPSVESCNGLDDDCNGAIDETFADLFQPCFVGVGACQRAGVRVCAEGGADTVCSGVAGLPVAEACDGADNDCDGEVDEDFPGLGSVCIVGLGACQRAGVLRCAGDGLGAECSAAPGAARPEQCNGIDDDCDGSTDEDGPWADQGQPCTVGLGSCARPGIFVCDPADPAGPTRCDAQPGLPTAELCDGLDNDCDGAPDDDPVDSQLCAEQQGVCAGSRKTCGGARGYLPCNSSNFPAAFQSTETACDGLDNDCDGEVDEQLVGPPCALQDGVCAGTRQLCSGGAWAPCGAASYGPTYEETEATCDLLDNDCDGETDEGWKNDGEYDRDTACGNCFTDCTAIYARPNAFGRCANEPLAVPRCVMVCDPGYFDLNLVPDDGCELMLDPGAIYVSSTDPAADDLPGCGLGPRGTGEQHYPCRSIAAGVQEALARDRVRVLVADGLYEETVTLVNEVSLLGGFRADTWERHRSSTLAIVRGQAEGLHGKTVVAQGIDRPTLLEGFVIYGPSSFVPGGNSYAVWVADSTSALTMRSNLIYGGYAAPGARGQDGADGVDGVAGRPGQDSVLTTEYKLNSCNALASTPGNQGPAGDGGQHSCGGQNVHGGAGAGAECPDDNDAQPAGSNGLAAAGGGTAGAGGEGGHDRRTTNCGTFSTGGHTATGMPGADGGDGDDGALGPACAGAAAHGRVEANEWVGSAGGDGGAGRPGGGGGGGGAGGGADVDENCSGDDDCLGGSGGGGGSGACGGGGGQGGGHGGGAFGVFVSFSAPAGDLPVITGNTIMLGQGGDGGNGGQGGAGGLGGDGGNGGLPTGQWDYAMGPGGRGGQGGDGGHGAGGNGGCGGVSYGLFVHNHTVPPSYGMENTILAGGGGGAGGAGGHSLGRSGLSGAAGEAAGWRF